MKANEEDKIELEELTRLRDFHFSEYNRFKHLLEKKRTTVKANHILSCTENTDISKAYWKNKRRVDLEAVHSILNESRKELGTGELCTLLNEKMQYVIKKYDSNTFMTMLGNTLKSDDKIYSYAGNVNGRRSTVYGLSEWKINKSATIHVYKK